MQFEVPARISSAVPDQASLRRIREHFAKSATPVRPLPSNLTMTLICVAVFCALALLFAIPVGFSGFRKLSAAVVIGEYSVVLLLALVLAGAVIAEMIPGSRRVLSPVTATLVTILLLSLSAGLLFPDFALQGFVTHGYPCLRLGVLASIPAAAAVWMTMRSGFVTDPVPAAIAGGALAGLLGLGVLALHCPIFNAAHIIGWHVGVIAVTALSGALLGGVLSRAR